MSGFFPPLLPHLSPIDTPLQGIPFHPHHPHHAWTTPSPSQAQQQNQSQQQQPHLHQQPQSQQQQQQAQYARHLFDLSRPFSTYPFAFPSPSTGIIENGGHHGPSSMTPNGYLNGHLGHPYPSIFVNHHHHLCPEPCCAISPYLAAAAAARLPPSFTANSPSPFKNGSKVIQSNNSINNQSGPATTTTNNVDYSDNNNTSQQRSVIKQLIDYKIFPKSENFNNLLDKPVQQSNSSNRNHHHNASGTSVSIKNGGDDVSVIKQLIDYKMSPKHNNNFTSLLEKPSPQHHQQQHHHHQKQQHPTVNSNCGFTIKSENGSSKVTGSGGGGGDVSVIKQHVDSKVFPKNFQSLLEKSPTQHQQQQHQSLNWHHQPRQQSTINCSDSGTNKSGNGDISVIKQLIDYKIFPKNSNFTSILEKPEQHQPSHQHQKPQPQQQQQQQQQQQPLNHPSPSRRSSSGSGSNRSVNDGCSAIEKKTIEVQCDGPDWTPIVLSSKLKQCMFKQMSKKGQPPSVINSTNCSPKNNGYCVNSNGKHTPIEPNDCSARKRLKSEARGTSTGSSNDSNRHVTIILLPSPSPPPPSSTPPPLLPLTSAPLSSTSSSSTSISISTSTPTSSSTISVSTSSPAATSILTTTTSPTPSTTCTTILAPSPTKLAIPTTTTTMTISSAFTSTTTTTMKASSAPTPTITTTQSIIKTQKVNDVESASSRTKASPSTPTSAIPKSSKSIPVTIPPTSTSKPSTAPGSNSKSTPSSVPATNTSNSQQRVRRRRFRSGLDMIRSSKNRKKAKQSPGSTPNSKVSESSAQRNIQNKKVTPNDLNDVKGTNNFDDASSTSSSINTNTSTRNSRGGVGGVSGGGNLSSLSPSSVPIEIKRLMVNKALGETILHRAARQGYTHIVRHCLKTGTYDINARDNAGYTPLHECCSRGHLEIARALLEHGADVDASATGGVRPFHDAVESDHIETVRLLLSYGSDPTIATYTGTTPLKLARSSKMITFLRGVIYDLTGEIPGHPDEEKSDRQVPPWKFEGSSSFLDPKVFSGYDVFNEDSLPCDEDSDESDDIMMELSDVPHLPTYRIKSGAAVSISKPASSSKSSDKTNKSNKMSSKKSTNTTDSKKDIYTQNYLKLCDILKQMGLSKNQFITKHKNIEILCLSTINLESNVLTSWKNSSHQSTSSVEESSQLSELICLDDPIREVLGIETLRVP